MRIGIIGGGASGIYAALLIKRKHPSFDVFIIEKEDRLGKKLCATGNGHCNLLNADIKPNNFNEPDFVASFLERYPYSFLKETFESFGILLTQEDNGPYIYPLSFNAPSFVSFLGKLLSKYGVDVHLSTRFLDYKNDGKTIEIKTDKGIFEADRLIFSCGGASGKNLGSDGSLFSILKGHGYRIKEPLPGLTPIKCKEKRYLKPLSGIRHKAKVTLFENQEIVKVESGEVLFKEDGLSGIVIFDIESAIKRRRNNKPFLISIDLLPNEHNLCKTLLNLKKINGDFYLDAMFVEPLASEIKRQASLTKTGSIEESLSNAIHHLNYAYEDCYPFVGSQVTIGGLALEEVNPMSLCSLKEDNVGFIGECLDIDGDCGGFNLSWALLSALAISEGL
jgi:predicted Rossmann fold flavoprotein